LGLSTNASRFFEERGGRYYLTAYGDGYKKGDRISIPEGEFEVVEIDYYLDPPDLFASELVKVK
jgi:hypothetical protein